MYLCYVDESGDGQTVHPSTPEAPPVMVIGGIVVEESALVHRAWTDRVTPIPDGVTIGQTNPRDEPPLGSIHARVLPVPVADGSGGRPRRRGPVPVGGKAWSGSSGSRE